MRRKEKERKESLELMFEKRDKRKKNKRLEMAEDELDARDLTRRVCEFLGVELQWLVSAKQIWIVDSETGDMVTAVMELKDGKLQEQPLEVTRDSVLLKVETESNEIVAEAFLECIGIVKRLSRGLDVETLEPVKTVENPFFGLKSREEIAVKLDLLAG